MVLLYGFFFKQKTAYEMRISDWSSDVCSADLRPDITGILGDSGGIQPGLLAAEIFTASSFPAEVADLNLEVANHALRNREQGVSACCIDFSESDWKVEEV